MDASIPPGKPAQVWIGAVLLTSSGFSTVVTALPHSALERDDIIIMHEIILFIICCHVLLVS